MDKDDDIECLKINDLSSYFFELMPICVTEIGVSFTMKHLGRSMEGLVVDGYRL